MKHRLSIIIITILSVAIIILPYVICFHSAIFSRNPSDWTNFASYVNGLLTPVLMIINIIILIGVEKAVNSINVEKYLHKRRLSKNNNNQEFAEFAVKINPEATAEDNLRDLHKQFDRVEALFSAFELSDNDCEADLYKLARKAKLCKKAISALRNVPYYENPFCNRMWEYHSIGATNTMTLLRATLKQLEVNVYELIYNNSPTEENRKNYLNAQHSLENFQKESQLVD